MSQRREIEARLALYDDLSGILGAMRSFALAELHRVTRCAAAQLEVVQTLLAALHDLAPALSEPVKDTADIWLLFGSVRGFCGSFNEDVVRTWRAAGAPTPTVVVGERLAGGLGENGGHIEVAGALGALDAVAAIDRILAALDVGRQQLPAASGLMVCFRDDSGARCERLLPLPPGKDVSAVVLPLTLEPAAHLAEKVVEHYLFHALLSRLLCAIRVENHMRLTQMENALQHIGRSSEELQRQRNRLRQEEIVEEIELIVQERRGLG
ncbi:MAG: F0F1 ATP synthase subunit gamma [Gammaproteobacteria bacterium]|nr:F0F1 ATP synthase subunit gamma [Gammaproteobacteria bacterium]MBU2435952.1 F0F1 ATP synthase subunit gamma [Gammaproteobacteria bacterium]MBU2449266.1 F0F1 ATP synthase subunit gamma [Gammaproteobacteria bacterium]